MTIRRQFRSCVLLLSAVAAIAGGRARADDESLARHVPAQVGLFVEARGIDDLLVSLTEPQVWLALAELAGQPAKLEEAEEWRARIRQTVKMDPAEAIRTLFSRGVAFCGEGLGRSQDALVLCRPVPNAPLQDLLKKWEAQPAAANGPQPASVYRLRNNIGVAAHDGLLIFGDPTAPDSLFRRSLAFATASRPISLHEDPAYRGLLARVPEKPDGVLFARLNTGPRNAPPPSPASAPAAAPASAPVSQTVSQPSSNPIESVAISDLPGPFRDASNILLALHRQKNLLHFSAVGDAPPRVKTAARPPLTPLVATLPERTLFAWRGYVDYPALAQGIERLPERHPIRIGYELQAKRQIAQKLLDALDAATCFAVGLVNPERRPVAAPPVPAAAVLLSAKQPAVAASEFAELVKASVSVYNLLALSRGLPHLEPPAEENFAGVTLNTLDLGGILQKIDNGAIGELHLCWALDGDTLIVATHADWLRQILTARHGAGAGLGEVLKLAQKPISADTETILVVQSGPIADLGALWLKYLEKTRPEILQEGWWRKRQPGGADVRLGITVTENAEKKTLRVDTVAPGQPADGRLRAGDQIIGDQMADGTVRRFATTQPVQEVLQRIAQRPNARWIDLAVQRGGATTTLRMPLPFIDPVLLLRRAVSIGNIAQRIVYSDDVPDAAGPRGFLTIELRNSRAPLFDLEPQAAPQLVGPPTSEPATPPAPQPAPQPTSQPAAAP